MPAGQHFDIAIVGSGFGGSTLGYALSHAGLRVAIIERGRWPARDEQDWNARSILIDKRYQTAPPVAVKQYRATEYREVPSDAAVGGLSVFYGGATLRLREDDFARWPIGYAELEPYYGAAERLLEVHGQAGADPFEPPRSAPYPYAPAEMTGPASRIHKAAQELDLRPFMLPLALNQRNAQRERCVNCFTCDGFPCKIAAKNDMTTTALRQANHEHLTVFSELAARRVIWRDDRAEGVACVDLAGGAAVEIRAPLVVLACGALHTPALLLASALGERDRSGAVGRYLMRHCNAIVGCVFPFKVNPEAINHKQIGVSHFYQDLRAELGTSVGIIQDMCMPPADAVRHLAPRGFRSAAYRLSSYIQSLICIAEDEPQRENAVGLAGEHPATGLPIPQVSHSYSPADLRRRALLIRQAKRILRRSGGLICKTRPIDSFSHAVGSVRFGDSPEAAPLDRDCRYHPLRNLFVVDGCFMPTSGGVNPSLTITANALRVADHIKENLGQLRG